MLRALASLSPIIVLLIGALPSGLAAWFAHGVKFDLFDRPAIVSEATNRANDAATIRIMDAANKAQQAERSRQLAAGAEALRIWREALEATERAASAEKAQLEQENQAYAAQLKAEGRGSPWTQRDLDERRDWLLNNWPAGTD